MNTTDIKRIAADCVKRGDGAGLKRLVVSITNAARQLKVQAEWTKNRVAKMKLQHEVEYNKELAKAAANDAEAKESAALLAELQSMIVPEPTPIKPADAHPPKSRPKKP